MANSTVRVFLRPVGDPSDDDGLYRWMVRYLGHIRSRGYTEQTLWGFERYIRDFIRWCDSRALSKLDAIGVDDLQAYLLHLHTYRTRLGRPLAWNSKESKLISVRSFFRWLHVTGRLPTNPAANLKLSQRPWTGPRAVPTSEEIEKILGLPDVTRPKGIRDRAMLELFFSAGLRRAELAALLIGDLDFDGKTVHVRNGKGGKHRLVPVADQALRWVRRYLDEVRGAAGPECHLFLTRLGQAFNLCWLTSVIGAYVHAALPGQSGACHILRHSMATSMLENGADIRHIQVILGHSELTSTQIYTHVSLGQLRSVYERTHPTARKTRSWSCAVDNIQRELGLLTEFHREVIALLHRLPPNAGWIDLIYLASAMGIAKEVAVVAAPAAIE